MKNAAAGRVAAPALVLMSALALGACDQNTRAPGAQDDTLNESGETQLVKGVMVANPRLMLSPVSGNPAAVYFDLTYIGDATVALDSVTVEGAQNAMIHQMGEDGTGGAMMMAGPITLNSGETFQLKPGGYHVMAMEMSPDIKAGQTTSVTITLSDGSTHTFEAEVNAAGEER
ncbi:hypothetical protein EH31_01810 [Erythrobacter longus]|uniref:Copper chaperone PCu(A)C n=1 Tax=Erythrobacter longus TaxID=1044 RepID=A0A074MF68_ERYLO|nr:copper chaperone PCu(A)C [Erythrobacter longus]KEO91425.1 hypothetical protein EH31_01810 [Erythrobacter longus]